MSKLVPIALLTFASCGSAYASEIKTSGDFRYRVEQTDNEFINENGNVESDPYVRTRIRARLKMSSQIHEKIKINLQLATGGSSATSTNQTLGSGFGNSEFRIDMAYFEYFAAEGLVAGGGKVKNPVYKAGKSEAVFDGDVTPTGLYLTYDKSFGAFSIHPVLASFTLYENNAENDQELGIAQLRGRFANDTLSVDFGGSLYQYSGIKGMDVSVASPKGNSVETVNGVEVYANDYILTEVFAALEVDLGGQPFGVFVQSISNSEADEDNTATTFGVSYGKGKGDKPWKFSAYSRVVEADAVYSPISDGDFNGGNTDGEGLVLAGKYAVVDSFSVGLKYFMTESPIEPAAGSEALKGTKAQLDFGFKF